MLGLAAFPATLQLLGFLFMPESPRWLVYRGRETQAFNVLVEINRKSCCIKNDDRAAYCSAADELTNILKVKNKENGVILTLLLLSLSFFLIEYESDRSAIISQDENFNNQDACSNYS
uniref:Uncharacterized protein n=1 Tax=Romanomermis culicivorax TaxID=13658 RepID=A0A915IH24_ROMCU